ncbi:MAG: DUF86 domain-containing protein [Candidatus Wallbacteria bacterium]|nr:DUF86 domain-containing protein [Candidatus Wallbacteria bacterium]
MADFHYARGRIIETINFIALEMAEFEADYAGITKEQYHADRKLQKLADRTVENAITALIELAGALLSEAEIQADSYADALSKAGSLLKLTPEETEILSRFASHRNRLAHRYLNFRFEVIGHFNKNIPLIKKVLKLILNAEK